jgi:hypothetical protein
MVSEKLFWLFWLFDDVVFFCVFEVTVGALCNGVFDCFAFGRLSGLQELRSFVFDDVFCSCWSFSIFFVGVFISGVSGDSGEDMLLLLLLKL